jgi:hypothetical protein
MEAVAAAFGANYGANGLGAPGTAAADFHGMADLHAIARLERLKD